MRRRNLLDAAFMNGRALYRDTISQGAGARRSQPHPDERFWLRDDIVASARGAPIMGERLAENPHPDAPLSRMYASRGQGDVVHDGHFWFIARHERITPFVAITI